MSSHNIRAILSFYLSMFIFILLCVWAEKYQMMTFL